MVLASRFADKLDATVNQIHSMYPGAQLYSITMDLAYVYISIYMSYYVLYCLAFKGRLVVCRKLAK